MPGPIDASDRWSDRLSDYLDGELAESERVELERHLRICPTCARTLTELEAVKHAGRALAGTTRGPSRDLWPGIASRIGAAAASDTAASDTAGSAPAGRSTRQVWRRRFSFSLPQLAAAAVVLVAATGLVLAALSRGPGSHLARGTAAGPARQAQEAAVPAVGSGQGSAGSASLVARSAPAASATPELDRAASDLEAVIARERSGLDPATVKVLDRNVAVIDSAIAQIRAALARDPGDIYLNRSLTDAMRRKVAVLRLAAKLAGASS